MPSLRPFPARFVNVKSPCFYGMPHRFFSQTRFWFSRVKKDMSAQPEVSSSSQNPDYSKWSTSSLVERIMDLERQLKTQTQTFHAFPDTSSSSSQNPQTKSEANEITTTSKPQTGYPGSDPATTPDAVVEKQKKSRDIDPSKYHTRHIALKLAYLGQRYNGFEHANGNITPLPTIEEELWKALRRARLIFPTTSHPSDFIYNRDGPDGARPFELSWDGCQYSKSGRTDRGVSAFGQVIGVRVRSARPKRQSTEDDVLPKVDSEASVIDSTNSNMDINTEAEIQQSYESEADNDGWDDIQDELPYIQILNSVLPNDIRILAWCPRPPADFDARFSCRERQYRYFFTQPAFLPTPGNLGFTRSAAHRRGIAKKKLRDGWLDIEAMREACKHFLGAHDFRNFCRVDTSKQINNFERMIHHASIDLVDPSRNPLGFVGSSEYQPSKDKAESATESTIREDQPSTPLVYTFTLHGSAFLWHQVRHMVAILFLVGQGVENPSIVKELLDISKNPCKPMYEMASDAPLVLWDCIFPDAESGSRKDALDWVYCGDPKQASPSAGKGDDKFGPNGLLDSLWEIWRQRKMDEILAGTLLDLAVNQGSPSFIPNELPKRPSKRERIFYGGNQAKLNGAYIPTMQKRKNDTVEVQNARYLASRERRAERQKSESQT